MKSVWVPINEVNHSSIINEQILCEESSPSFAGHKLETCENIGWNARQRQVLSARDVRYCANTIEIPLNDGLFTVISCTDLPLVLGYKWRAIPSPKNRKPILTWYVVSSTNVLMHRLILGIHKLGRTVETDHRDGNGLNNVRDNLRIATRSVNTQNRRKFGSTSSKHRGVKPSSNGKRWLSRIYHDSKPILLGTHDTEEQAARAYDAAAIRLFGPDARLNFPLPCTAPLKAA